jgi:hypothetical protein
MAPLIPAMIAAKQMNLGALNNDIAVYRSTKMKGKGKKKRKVETEYHVNPVSLTVGVAVGALGLAAAAAVGAVGLYAAGLGASREAGVTKTRTVRRVGNNNPDPSKQTWAIYNERGVPIGRFVGLPTPSNALTPNDLSRGWTVTRFVAHDDYYIFDAQNAEKRHFALSERPRGGLITVGGGKLF